MALLTSHHPQKYGLLNREQGTMHVRMVKRNRLLTALCQVLDCSTLLTSIFAHHVVLDVSFSTSSLHERWRKMRGDTSFFRGSAAWNAPYETNLDNFLLLSFRPSKMIYRYISAICRKTMIIWSLSRWAINRFRYLNLVRSRQFRPVIAIGCH